MINKYSVLKLDSKYPILMTAMNQVSDLNLALAGHRAGIFPSLSLFNYCKNNRFRFDEFEKDLDLFQKISGSNNLLISLDVDLLLTQQVLDILVGKKFFYIEIVEGLNFKNIPKIQKIRKDLTHKGLLIFVKEIAPRLIMETDVLILKGNEGAGRFLENSHSLKELFSYMTKAFPSLPIIPSGGIKNAEDVEYYIERNACAVGIGSLFAYSEESCVSKNTKNVIVKSTSDDITRIKNKNQNGISFEEIQNDNENNTVSLKLGIKDTINGHVFVGKSVDSINSIKTVKEIVDELILKTNNEFL